MADTVRMTKDGESYDIPKEIAAQAFADGLRPERSAFETFMDIGADSNLLARAYEHFAGKEDAPGAVAAKYGQQMMVSKDGKDVYVMPASVAQEAYNKGELRLPNYDDKKERELAIKAEAGIDPSNEGVRGMLKAGTASARNEFVKTATFGALDPAKDLLSDDQRARFEQSQKMNPISSGAGSALGFAGGVVADPFSIGGIAGQAGSAAERAVAGEATSLGGKVLGGIARGATEGAVMSVPAATRAAIEGDPEKAAEAMLLNAGVGGLIRGTGPLVGRAVDRLAPSVKGGLEELSTAADTRLGRYEAATNPALSAEERIAMGTAPVTGAERVLDATTNAVGKAAKWAAKAGGTAAGAVLGGGGGAVAGGYLGSGVGHAAQSVVEGEAAQKLFMRATRATARGLLRVGPVLDEMAFNPDVQEKVVAGSLNALSQLVGAPAGATKQEQFSRVQDRLAGIQADPQKRADAITNVVSAVPDGPVKDALAMKANNVIDYLYSQLPKQQASPGLFQKKQAWTPTDNQLASFQRKVQVVMDPFSVVNELRAGTLTSDHVDALRAVYPALAQQLNEDIIAKGSGPKAPALKKAQRQQLQLLLGQPLDDSTSPSAVALYQSLYGGNGPSDPNKAGALPASAPIKPIKVQKLPSSMTEAQRISNGLPKPSR